MSNIKKTKKPGAGKDIASGSFLISGKVKIALKSFSGKASEFQTVVYGRIKKKWTQYKWKSP